MPLALSAAQKSSLLYQGLGLRFNADGPRGPDCSQGMEWGQPSKLNDIQRKKPAKIVDDGSIPPVHSVVRWRLKDLDLWIFEDVSYFFTRKHRQP